MEKELRDILYEIIDVIKEKQTSQDKETLKKARMYVELREQLAQIKVKVSKIEKYADANGREHARVFYEMPVADVTLDDDGEYLTSKSFIAINYLNLLSYEDISDLMSQLDEMLDKKVK